MNERMTYLDHLYFLDGRDNPDHEHYMTYTGLGEKYRGKKDDN